MIVFLAILLIVGFLATSLISFVISRDSIRQSIVERELPLTSDNVYSEIQRDLLKPIFISSLMANDTFLRAWVIDGEKNISEIERYLGEIKQEYKTITAFFVSEKTRRYYYPKGLLKVVSEDETRDAWFFRVKSLQTPYEINVDPDMANKDTMTIFINYKVFDFQGNFIGATGVGLTVDTAKKLISNYRSRYDRNVYFFNDEGKLVLHASDKILASPGSYRITDMSGLEGFSVELEEAKKDSLEYQQTSGLRLLNVRYIPGLKWFLVVEQTDDHTMGLLSKTLAINLTICFIISIITLGIIHITLIRYQEGLENRNKELETKNRKIDEQRSLLEQQTQQLQKNNDDLKMMNHEKDEFIGITAHDLKSPLNAIIGFAELIQFDEGADESSRQYAVQIVNSSLKMVDHINNLMDAEEAGSDFVLELQPFDIRTSILRTIQDFKFQAQIKDITLNPVLPDHPVMTLGNDKWMVDIIGNLVSNAIKYSHRHKTVELHLTNRDQKVRLTVTDQGPGLTKADLPKLFKKYSLASTKPTAGETSNGLGLYIVKKMTERMGGIAWCESKPGEGSQFSVEFSAA